MRSAGLKFALITTFYPPFHFGGDGVYVRNHAHALVRRGHSVDVIHSVDPFVVLGGNQSLNAPDEPDGIRVFSVKSRFPKLSVLATHQTGRPVFHGRELRKILESNQYDVIHFHNVSLVGGPDILSYGTGIKLYTAHEHWLVCPTHILWKNNKEICQSKACVTCTLRHRRPPQLWRYTNLLENRSKHVDVFMALSQSSADAHSTFGFKPEMKVFPSFVPEPLIRRKDQETGVVRPYFLFVGRLERIKGLQDVLPLFVDGINADLLVAGTGDLKDQLELQAQGVRNIKFLGQVAADELAALYRDATALIVPSRCLEVFPLVALEAFRVATPVVATDQGPFPELIKKTRAGLTYTGAEDLRSKLKRLLGDPALRNIMGQAGLAAYHRYWTEDTVFTEYFSVIRRVADQRGLDATNAMLERCDDSGYLQSPPPPE